MRTPNTTASCNAVCQAVKILCPGITRKAHREICGYPYCPTATNRYWRETYNILPWKSRTIEERNNALRDAAVWIAHAVTENGVFCPRVKKMIQQGKVSKPSTSSLSLAGYRYHHTAAKQGYCRVDSIGKVVGYNGRFGHGLIRFNGCHNGSTIYESISYWIEKSR